MKIGGFQKFSMLDYPGQLAAIVFTQGCNFRCPYCHNPQLVDPSRYTRPLRNSRVFNFLRKRAGKLGAVVFSGGEPTCQPDLVEAVRLLRSLGYLIKIDTNGSLPDVIKTLADNQLVDYWAMDLKAPPELYQVLTRTKVPVDNILQSMDILRSSGRNFEFRTTFFEMLFDWSDIARIQSLLKPGDKYILQECRYTGTLEDVRNATAKSLDLETAPFLHLQDNPACRSLLQWGNQNQVKISIRSL